MLVGAGGSRGAPYLCRGALALVSGEIRLLVSATLLVEPTQIELEEHEVRQHLDRFRKVSLGVLPARVLDDVTAHEDPRDQPLKAREAHHLVVEPAQQVVSTGME